MLLEDTTPLAGRGSRRAHRPGGGPRSPPGTGARTLAGRRAPGVRGRIEQERPGGGPRLPVAGEGIEGGRRRRRHDDGGCESRRARPWPCLPRPYRRSPGGACAPAPVGPRRPPASREAVRAPAAIASFWHTTRWTARSRSAPIRNHSPTAFSAPDVDQRPSSSWTASRLPTVSRNRPRRVTAAGLVAVPVTRRTNEPGAASRRACRAWISPTPSWRGAMAATSARGWSRLRSSIHSGTRVNKDDRYPGLDHPLERSARPLRSGEDQDEAVGPGPAQGAVHRLDLGPRGAVGELGLQEENPAPRRRGTGLPEQELLVVVLRVVEQQGHPLGRGSPFAFVVSVGRTLFPLAARLYRPAAPSRMSARSCSPCRPASPAARSVVS